MGTRHAKSAVDRAALKAYPTSLLVNGTEVDSGSTSLCPGMLCVCTRAFWPETISVTLRSGADAPRESPPHVLDFFEISRHSTPLRAPPHTQTAGRLKV